MAKTAEKATEEKKMAEQVEPEAASQSDRTASGQAEQPRPQLELDDSKAHAAYANFCRVTGTPEELIIDLGLNKQPMGVSSDPIEIVQRVILNYYTAKRLLAALQMSVQRHEAAFGVLETNVQKRITPAAIQQMAQQRQSGG